MCNEGFLGDGRLCCDRSEEGTMIQDGACVTINITDAIRLEGGTRLKRNGTLSEGGEFGDIYAAEYDLTAAEGGLISLNSIASFVLSTDCSTNGTILILIDTDAIAIDQPASEIYPLGSVFIVDHERFGLCQRDEGDNGDDAADLGTDPEAFSRQQLFEMSVFFLQIEAVSGTFYDTFIQGKEVSFFDLFPEGSMDIQLYTENRRSRKELGIDLSEAPDGSLQGTVITPVMEYFNGKLKVQLRGTIKERGKFGALTPYWSKERDAFVMTLTFTQDTEVVVDLTTFIELGVWNDEKEFLLDALSYPIFSPPKVPIGNVDPLSTKDSGGFELSLSLGVYLQFPIILKADVKLEQILAPKPTLTYQTGLVNHSYSLSGPFYTPFAAATGIGSLVLMDFEDETEYAAASFDFEMLPKPLTNSSITGSNPLTLNVDTFVGIRPQVAVYLPFFKDPLARASVDIGVGLAIQLALEGSFSPIEQDLHNSTPTPGLKAHAIVVTWSK